MCCQRARIAKFACTVIFAGAGLVRAFSVEPGTAWYHRDWQTDDGLPAANVTGIAQTRDGYLWLATQSGLARFDGAQFDEIPVPVGRSFPLIRVMLCDHAENLWLAEDGGVVARVGPAGAQLFGSSNGLPDALPLQMAESGDKNVWIAYADRSTFRITPEGKSARVTAADGLPDDGTCSLTVDARGTLWFAKGAQFGFFRDGRFQKAGRLNERNAQIFGAHDGVIWFCTSLQLLRLEPDAGPVAVANFEADPNRVKPSVLFEDAAGRLWIGTATDGLFLLDHTNLFKIDTSQNNIRTITSDREGNIWVGTDGGGLNRLRQKTVELHGRDEGLPFETVRSLCEDGAGNLWIVTQDGALTRLAGDDWTSAQKIENWPGGQAHCVVTGKDGAIWIGTYLHGLFRWQGGTFTNFTTQNGLGGTTVRSLLVDSRNNLWIGLESGHRVQCLREGRFQSFELPADCRAVRAMAEDSAGQIWLGTLDGRLFRVEEGKILEMPPPTPESHPIRCLCSTPDGSLWIGCAVSGVCRLKAGKISRISRQNGLFDGNICALMPDKSGRMWFASDRGIFYVGLAQLNDLCDGRAERVQSIFFGRDAGLPSLQAYYGYWPGALADNAGEILFPTHSGIAAVHPDRVDADVVPPNVVIQSVTVDGRQNGLGKEAAAVLRPGHRRVEITFTVPSFIAPEQVRFRYRLEGWNDEWSEPGVARAAVFSRLPPGAYTFQVAACNSFGVWNGAGDSFRLIVAPFFWQHWYFRVLAAILFVGALAALVRYFSSRRVRLMLKKVEQEAALQNERARIAQHMHDELGARFTQISLLGELSSNAIAEPERARDLLGQISRVAQVGVKSLDEIVWAVNPRNDTLPDLLDYTGQYARDFLAAASLRCRLDFPDDVPPREVSGDVRHAVFLIVKEALHNVVKHARAAHVKITFELRDGEMLWLIEDDGKGFEQAPDNALADGLRNISQRAAALGGSAEIKSPPGAGTRITLKVPMQK